MQPPLGALSSRAALMMRAVRYVVYGVGLTEIVGLVYFGASLTDRVGPDSGGEVMAWFFYILLPLTMILAGLAAFHFGRNSVLRGFGLALTLLPLVSFVLLP